MAVSSPKDEIVTLEYSTLKVSYYLEVRGHLETIDIVHKVFGYT